MNSYSQQLEQLAQSGLQRTLQETLATENGYCTFNGTTMLNLSSNDYLGLNADTALKKTFLQQLDNESISFSGVSSRLLTGNYPLYSRLEKAIIDWMGCPDSKALFFNSGYHANVGILPVLSDKNDLIISDKLCHASLIDGIRLSSAHHLRFRHNDMEHLEKILYDQRHRYKRVFIVTESVFSMDGDCAYLSTLIALKQRYDAMLYLDEAHAIGAIGPKGRGYAAHENFIEDIDILVCPMGKSMASQGAMVIVKPTLHALLINTVRTLIFATSLPPISIAWSTFIIEHMDTFSAQRQTLETLRQAVNERLEHYHQKPSESCIIPIIIGDNHKTVALAEQLRQKKFLVFPIRPPTVAKNTARLRLSLTANMPVDDVLSAIDHIGEFLHK